MAKEVRTSTEIGAHSISMAAAAVRLAGQLFEDLSKTKVLFVGAGEMIELTATHFAARTPRTMAVANRTLERGEKLANHLGAQAMRLADLPQRLHEFDIVVSCTASSLPIIGLGAVERALKARKRRPMFMVDLAVPRDISPKSVHSTTSTSTPSMTCRPWCKPPAKNARPLWPRPRPSSKPACKVLCTGWTNAPPCP